MDLIDFKRQKSGISFYDGCNGPAENSDYYNESMHLSHGSGGDINLNLRSSWICDVKWFGRNELMLQQGAIPPKTLESELVDVREQMHHTSKKLILIKRLFAPQAGKLAMRCNEIGYTTTTKQEFERAREACNLYEPLGEGKRKGLNSMFMNRAAIKLANIDALLGFCLTTTRHKFAEFRFVDLCGAPGGFSEYILWRCRSHGTPATGYGMSLMGNNEHGNGVRWKVNNVNLYRNEKKSKLLICNGRDNTGDVYKWENLTYFRDFIQYNSTQSTDNNWKVPLVLADGGFDAQRDCENQEEIAQKLIVCEVAGALLLLQSGGILIIKMFGFQTPVICSVLNYLFSTFQSVVIVKPISSRPASAERYVCCCGFDGNPDCWDGQKWCNSMLLGYNYLVSGVSDAANHDILLRKFQLYFLQWDQNLLNLNLKACFAILTYLEDRLRRIQGGTETVDQFDNLETHRINISLYKYAWRLA